MRRLLIFVVVLAGLLLAADRLAAYAAASEVADQVQSAEHLSAKPGVSIGGFPFLTQAVAGRYDDVTVTAHDVTAGPLRFSVVVVNLRKVKLPLGEIIHRDVDRVPVARASGSLTISFGELDSLVPGGGVRFSRGSGHTIKVSGAVTIDGHSVSAQGAGSVSISDGELHVFLGSVTTPVVSLPLPALPFQLTGVGVSTSSAGVVIAATARGLVLRK